MNKNLLILGAGQYSTVVKEIAILSGAFDKIAFLDDNHGNGSTQEPTIGKMSDYDKFLSYYKYAIPAIGNANIRLEFLENLKVAGFKIPVLMSKQAYVSPSAILAEGVVIEPLASVHSYASIGVGSYISMGSVVNHNAVVGMGCHIDNNAVVMSTAVVEDFRTTEPCEVVKKKVPIKYR